VGYLIGNEEALAEVNKVRLPFNVNSASQALAVAALKDKKAMRKAIALVVKERGRLSREMSGVPGVLAYPSEANFVLFRVADAGRVHRGLLRRGVLVRNLGGIIEGCLRVTVGTREEDDAFLRALKESL
jgi:histidinol-phosphate aminotransferase